MKKLTGLLVFALILFLASIDLTYAGHALRFHRNQRQYVDIPDSESLDIRGQAITMEAWINDPEPGLPRELNPIIINKESSYEMCVQQNLFQVAIMTQGRWEWLGTGRIQANTWTHVAATYDGQNIRTYINGDLQSTHGKRGNIDPTNNNLRIGRRGTPDNLYFTGIIDEVRVWNVARSRDEIRESMNYMLRGDEEGLVGYWRLDEGEGQVAHDRCGCVRGQINRCIVFENENCYYT